jgi:ABC-type Na+ efflux pump permease subunit
MDPKRQFLPILKKDLKLVFNIKTILITVIVPFLMMFLIISLPTLFLGTTKATVYMCSDDTTIIQQHVNGTNYAVNLGEASILYVQEFAKNTSNLIIEIVDSQSKALNASNGIYFPAHFTNNTLNNGNATLFYHSSASSTSRLRNKNWPMIASCILIITWSKSAPCIEVLEAEL